MTNETTQQEKAAAVGASACSALLAAVNDADRSMMLVVKMLYEKGDPRARLMADLQSRFCAPLQNELGS